MSQKIYTKTGDKGHTALIGGTRVPKNHLRIEAYGTIDELNSWTGMLNDQFAHDPTRSILREIQDRLFTIGSMLATDPSKHSKMTLPDLKESDITLLEKEMDSMQSKLPELKAFILPGGHPTVSTAHITRCVCRRAERLCVGLQETHEPVDSLIIQYLNRLSDYYFVLSRMIAKHVGVEEIAWRARV